MLLHQKILITSLILAAATLLSVVCSRAGTTGKVAGKVTDSQTKEALIGVNVVIPGTTFGSATDIDGNYFIINIPPGVYELKASAVGYTPVSVKDVKVFVDQTTRINFELQSQAVEINTVEITASRPIVQKDITSTTATVTTEQLSSLPLEDVASVVNLQAGVVEGHFRGGRDNEVKYLIDGVSVNDVFSGNYSMQAEINSIQEIQVLSGTFNAEYGEALSGVVNQVTKIAGEKYSGDFSSYTGDYLTSRNRLFKNVNHVSPSDLYNFEGSISGPVPGTKNVLKFSLSGRWLHDDGYIYGKRVFNPSDSSNFSDNDPSKWYIGATGDGKYVPMNFQNRKSIQGKLSINVGSAKNIVLQGLYQQRDYREYDHRFQLNPDGDYLRFQKSFLGTTGYNHVISDAAFVDIKGSAFISDYKQYVYENPVDKNGNIHVDPRYVKPERMRDVSGNAFLSGGTENWHFQHHTVTYTGKVDLTDQLNPIHQIKTGLEAQLHTLRYEDYQVHVDATTNFVPSLPASGSFDFNVYKNHPYQLAAYFQDKIELDYLIVNVGIRYDYFQPDGSTLRDPNNIAVLDTLLPPFPSSLLVKARAKSQISPRIGLSYPITDRGAIHISYGHFFQIPAFEL